MFSRRILTAVALSLVSTLSAGRAVFAADTYTADSVHSSLVFRVKHMNVSNFWGRFNTITGSFSLDEANPAESRFDFQVKSDSIDTGDKKRDQHLKSPDFFNAVQFPLIEFKSQSVKKVGSAYEVSGELTLHGVTKSISVHVVPTGMGKGPTGAAIAGIEVSFSLKRSDFGMTKMVGPVADEVMVMAGIEGARR
jgi:polyisoprenoid-binding protein YceI